jgi:DNA-binding CsgD family transcriptional regulator
MKPCAQIADPFGPATQPGASEHGAMALDLLTGFDIADNADSAVQQFHGALELIGADAGVFLSVIRDDAARTSYRSLMACDPVWAIEYARLGSHEHDPWLRYALHNEDPVRHTELKVLPSEEAFVQASSRFGFASAVVVPAPSSAGTSRIGVLCLGSNTRGFFDGERYRIVRIVARALAMELHGWMRRAARRQLVARTGIKPEEIELLRHEGDGHTSKVIAAELHVSPKTVDCRFQRLCTKLDVPDRRTATRVAWLYGLL